MWEVVQQQQLGVAAGGLVREEELLEPGLRDELMQGLVVAEDHCARKLVKEGDQGRWTSKRFAARHPQHLFGQE